MMANRTGEVFNEAEQTGTHAREVNEDTTGLANALKLYDIRSSESYAPPPQRWIVDWRPATRWTYHA
jgi:hypothetical protein